jgi:RNA polymerase sigma-70 factor (ECF subfamily)
MYADSDAPRPAWLKSNQGGESREESAAASSIASLEREVLELYDAYSGVVSRYVMGVTGNEELSADVVQESFLLYIAHRRNGGAKVSGPAWFLREARQRIRSEHLKREQELDQMGSEQAALRVRDPARTPEQSCLPVEIRRLAIEVLAPRELDCLLLRSQGLGYEDIASTMNITSGAVGAMLSRALHKLQARVQKR